MVRRKEGDRGAKGHSLRPRGAGVYAIVDGRVVENEEQEPPADDAAAAPPSFARAALRSKRRREGTTAAAPPVAEEVPTSAPLERLEDPSAKPPSPTVGKQTLPGTGGLGSLPLASPEEPPSPTVGKQTLPGTGGLGSLPPASPEEPSADKPKTKKKRRKRKPKKKSTLPGTGPPSAPPPARRKETLIGAGLGKDVATAGGGPAVASMPPSGEAPPTDRAVPWVGGSDARVEVEIAPLPRRDEPKAPEPAEAESQSPKAADDEAVPAVEEPPSGESPPSAAGSDQAAAAEPTPQAGKRPPRIAGMPRGTAIAAAALLVVVVGVILVTMGPGSVPADDRDRLQEQEGTPDEGSRGSAPQAAQTATESAAPSASAAPAVSAEADGSELPLHEGYLVVQGANPKLYVYGRGKRLGQVGEKMRLRCGAISVRLGDRAPEHWYSSPRRLRVDCQSVTTETLEAGDPVSILEEAVPAEAPTSVSSEDAAFQPPPPSLPPPSSPGAKPDWVPPEI